jgi:dienelactone hydrolase
VLVIIGADDPIIPPEQRLDFEKEMKAAGIDWRLQLYGGAATVSPTGGRLRGEGLLLPRDDHRSWNAMIELFNER